MTRRRIVFGAMFVALAAAAWMALAARKDPAGRTQAAARGSAAAMEGMGGMSVNESGAVQLTPAQVRQFGLTFGTAEVRTMSAELRTTGQVTIDETRVTRVAPKFAGFAERLYVDFTGQSVRRGQPLLEIFSPELLSAQQELLLARRLDGTLDAGAVPGVPASAGNLLAAARRRLELWDVSGAQIDEVLRTGRARRTVTVFSPATGVVMEKAVVRGQSVEAGATLYTIADLSQVWVDVELREAGAAAVRPGVGADITLAALPGATLKGRVSYVYPTVDSVTRTVRARVTVSNSGMVLKPGMYATVRLYSASRRALSVPASAVIRTGERNVVFVDMGPATGLMPREVQTGATTAEYVEILSGLEAGQRVVTSAQFLLESESNLGEVMKAMSAQLGPGDRGAAKDMPGMKMP